MKKLLIIAVFAITISSFYSIGASTSTNALSVDNPCTTVELIFARGSGQEPLQDDVDADVFFKQINSRVLEKEISVNQYELGSQKYSGYQYPAVAVDNWSFLNGIGASLSAGRHYAYGDSVKQGVNELQTYITQRHAKCATSKTRYILGGYSQGAQVIGQALPGIQKSIRDDMVYVALFGDPKLHYPEGEGWNPPACRGERSVWRKVPVFNCNHDDGSLVARRPYLPDDMKTRTGLWCYDKDMVCDPGAIGQMSGHGEYKNKGRAIDHATQIAVTRLQGRLKQDTPPAPLPGQPAPEPVDYDKALNVRRVFNQGTKGENVVFAVDIGESMQPKLPAIKEYLRETIPKITARGGTAALAVYWGVKVSDGKVYTTGYGISFGEDLLSQIERIGTSQQTEFLLPGSSLAVFHAAFRDLVWTPGATKSIITFSDSSFVSPDAHGFTTEDTAKRALEIDPVNIYPVVPETVKASYTDIATQTSGQVLAYTDDIIGAANQAFDKITRRPVPFLSNIEYTAEPGQEVTFDASDSYVIDSSITKYDWDYNGDGQFEASTSTPSIKHVYDESFTGYMQVRISANNGTLANMSAKVTIGPLTQPVLPPAPQNLTYTITETSGNKSKITINWQANAAVEAWLVELNGMPMGHVEGSRTSLELTDIERTNDVVIRVGGASGLGGEFNKGEFSSITIAAIQTTPPPPPIFSTCTQSNLLIQLLCKAIALVKIYIQGIWYYILPYKL